MAGYTVCLSLGPPKAAHSCIDVEIRPCELCCPRSYAYLLAVHTPWPYVPQVLWPYLLEFLIPVRFTAALTPLCRSLVHLALKRQEAEADASLVQYNLNGVEAQPPCI